jgi:hypothetical protein
MRATYFELTNYFSRINQQSESKSRTNFSIATTFDLSTNKFLSTHLSSFMSFAAQLLLSSARGHVVWSPVLPIGSMWHAWAKVGNRFSVCHMEYTKLFGKPTNRLTPTKCLQYTSVALPYVMSKQRYLIAHILKGGSRSIWIKCYRCLLLGFSRILSQLLELHTATLMA